MRNSAKNGLVHRSTNPIDGPSVHRRTVNSVHTSQVRLEVLFKFVGNQLYNRQSIDCFMERQLCAVRPKNQWVNLTRPIILKEKCSNNLHKKSFQICSNCIPPLISFLSNHISTFSHSIIIRISEYPKFPYNSKTHPSLNSTLSLLFSSVGVQKKARRLLRRWLTHSLHYCAQVHMAPNQTSSIQGQGPSLWHHPVGWLACPTMSEIRNIWPHVRRPLH